MSAPVLNLGFLSPAPTPGVAGASGQGQAALGGFEALLAALFGPVEALGAPVAAEGQAAPTETGPTDETAETDAPAGAEAQMLLAMMAAPATQAEPRSAPADGEPAPVATATAQGATTANLPLAEAAVEGLDLAALPKPAATDPSATAEAPPAAAHAKHAAPPPPPRPAPAPEAEPAVEPAPIAAEAGTETATEALVAQTPTRPRSEAPEHRRDGRPARSDDGVDALAGAADDNPALRPTPRTATTTAVASEPVDLPAAAGAPAIEPVAPEAPKTQAAGATAPGAAAHAPPLPEHAQGLAVRGAPETVAHLAANILKKLESRSTRFDVELEPAGLGRVDVRVEIAANGRLTAAMAFDNPQAAAEVKGRAADLARALEQAGFDISGGLSFDVAGDQGRPRHEGQESASQGLRGRAFQAVMEAVGDAPELAPAGSLYISRRTIAGLDIRI